jgi:hypothetical protein
MEGLGPKRVSQEVAQIMAVHATAKNAAIVRWANALYAERHGDNSGAPWIDCEWCDMPVRANPYDCERCKKQFPCCSPFCLPVAVASTNRLDCSMCFARQLCPQCIQAAGCINCGRHVCKDCAFACHIPEQRDLYNDHQPITLTICSAECVRDTAKRAKVEKE